MATDLVIIFVTCASRKEAASIADTLLKKRLIACAGMIAGVESRFWWKGSLERVKEVLVTMKTRQKNFKAVELEIKRLHSYEVPEIITLPIIRGNKDYLGWIKESVR